MPKEPSRGLRCVPSRKVLTLGCTYTPMNRQSWVPHQSSMSDGTVVAGSGSARKQLAQLRHPDRAYSSDGLPAPPCNSWKVPHISPPLLEGLLLQTATRVQPSDATLLDTRTQYNNHTHTPGMARPLLCGCFTQHAKMLRKCEREMTPTTGMSYAV